MNRIRCCGSCRERRRGFTIVELLVVLGILIVLIGLAIPATSKVRTSAMRTQCLNNMRGLQLAHLAYAAEHRGHFVNTHIMDHRGLTDQEVEDADKPIWYFVLQEYYETALVLKSPLDNSPHWPRSMGGNGEPTQGDSFRRTSYGMNDYLMPHYDGVVDPDLRFDRLSKVRSPAHTINFAIVAFEGEFAGSDHFHPEDWLNNPYLPAPIEEFAMTYVQTNAHGGPAKTWDARSGYSFVDGHVATNRFGEIVLPVESADYNKFNPQSAVAIAAHQMTNR
jgi:type II secretory pathway pseudopilin PulG